MHACWERCFHDGCGVFCKERQLFPSPWATRLPSCPESCSKAVLSFSNLIDINFKPFACIPTGLFASSLSELNAQQIIIYLSYFCVFLCKINSFVLNFC